MLLGRMAASEATGHSWRRNLSRVPPPTGGGKIRLPCHPFKEHFPMNSFLNAAKNETLRKGFLPRVSMLIFHGNHYRMASLFFPKVRL
jgi:hypothetical protein